jgi:fucose permease
VTGVAAAGERLRRSPLAAISPTVGVTTVFFVNGLLYASWTAHIPHVKDYLRLSDGSLGIALLGASAGSVLAMLIVARLLPRFGSRLIVRITLVGYCLAGPLVGLAGSVVTLFGALMLWGAFQGTLDVSMNTQGITVERQAGRPRMPGFHGSWSIGSLAGAATGAGGVAIGLSLSGQLLILAAPCLLIGGWLTIGMLPDARPRDDAAKQRAPQAITRNTWVIIAVLGGIATADMLCEGAAADWAAVYLHTSLGVTPAVAALGFTTYLLAMVAVRLSGNRLLRRFPARFLLPAFTGIATVLFATGLAVDQVPVMLVAFAALGAGLASVIPVVFSAAGRIPGIDAGTAVTLVSACGWAGFLCGPVVIGQLADATSLRLALVAVPVLTAVIAGSTASCRALRTDPRPAN